MPIPKLVDFFTDPKHKEESDFLRGVIDTRVKELADQYEIEKKKKKRPDSEREEESKDENGSFFDALFGGKK